jgi:peptidoglycan hydrolase-like protein with peptidoglycan-binding domain
MIKRNIVVCALSGALMVTSAHGALADGGSAFVGGLLGGALGSAIANSAQQQRQVVQPQRTVRRAPAPAVNAYQREENRRIQTALNYFGFNAGPADGVLGRNSRSAIGQYQAFLSYPPTGALTDYEKIFLTSSYERAIVGGARNVELIAAQGQGVRGLLLAYRQEQAGAPVTAAAAPLVVVPPSAEATTPETGEADAEVVTAEAGAGGPLPSFLAGGPTGSSMASHCNRVNLSTNSNGGFVTLATMTSPNQALGEQFCLARSYAVEQGDSLAGTVQGFSMAEMQAQCEAFAPSMREYQARLVSRSPAEAATALQDFVVATGAAPAQLSANARICLGIGYRTDNSELALASAMVLVGLGEAAYGELLGHHLMNGFATPRRPDRGLEWLGATVEALEGGAAPLVASGGAARTDLLRQAVLTLSGDAPPEAVVQDAAAPEQPQGFVLPVPEAAAN